MPDLDIQMWLAATTTLQYMEQIKQYYTTPAALGGVLLAARNVYSITGSKEVLKMIEFYQEIAAKRKWKL